MPNVLQNFSKKNFFRNFKKNRFFRKWTFFQIWPSQLLVSPPDSYLVMRFGRGKGSKMRRSMMKMMTIVIGRYWYKGVPMSRKRFSDTFFNLFECVFCRDIWSNVCSKYAYIVQVISQFVWHLCVYIRFIIQLSIQKSLNL